VTKKMPKSYDLVKGLHALCYRCEHRALWLDTRTHRPRCECGDTTAKHSCYMYEPVKPLVMEVDKGERRSPFMGWMIAGRSHAIGLPVTCRCVYKRGKKYVIFHQPCTNKEKKEAIDALHTPRRARKV
jgi:hypothetical protein